MPFKFNIEGPETKKARQAQALRDSITLEAAQLDLEEKKRKNPQYAAQLAGDIAEKSAAIQDTLNLTEAQKAGISERLGNISSAATPLESSIAGPVMPQEAAMQAGQGLVAEENLLNARNVRLRAELEAYRKQQEGLVGTVNLGDAYGTAPAGDEANTFRRRVRTQSELFKEGREYINQAPTPEEAQDRSNAVMANKTFFDAQTREELKNSRKLPGLTGMAKDEDSAKKMRERVPAFVQSVATIDRLVELGDEYRKNFGNPILERKARAEAEQLRIPLIANLRIPLTGGGQMSVQELELIQRAIANPATFFDITQTDRLKSLKKTIGSEFSSAARNYGYELNSLQQVIDANSAPSDIETFGVRRKAVPQVQEKPAGRYDPTSGRIIR